ncbi:MAG: glutamate synthase-related protein [Planctomycetota bacterium]|jgi:glutamate synthase domain-containing protein 2/CDGSH-type Zn-finger protein
MDKPIISDIKPCRVSLEPGQDYYFCACGKSKNQPFCDGSHAGTGITPQAFTATDNEAHLCMCKNSANPPLCDGSHNRFTSKDIGTTGAPAESDNGPVVSDNKPTAVTLTKGETYHFCTCGKSKNQPFCDGSHAGTAFTPQAFTAEADGDAHLCLCKHSANPPLCDGSHNRFTSDDIGKTGPGPAAPSTANNNSSAGSEDLPRAAATPEEPTVAFIHQLAREGLSNMGHHGPMTSMGVPRADLPDWNDLQLMVAQLASQPLQEDQAVATELVIGPEATKPLTLSMPLFVSDMSFGALSQEAKTAMARGAELAGTGICSGEGGMLPAEQAANSRYFYELASAKFGYREELMSQVQAFHFKGGQGAKTGTGGHLPGSKNIGAIAEVRGLKPGTPAVSPPTFSDLHSVADFARFADRVREISGGIPIGFKLSANHIERDVQFALDAGADYLILDGRGGGTGAAPEMFRDHISVPTIPALARARRHLDQQGASGRVTLIITGGLRTPIDFVKALALGADGVALANSAMQAIGCIGARMCNSNNCPAGIATQKPELRKKLNVEAAAERLERFLNSSVELMQVMARACGHNHLNQFNNDDLATWQRDLAQLAGVRYSGVTPL